MLYLADYLDLQSCLENFEMFCTCLECLERLESLSASKLEESGNFLGSIGHLKSLLITHTFNYLQQAFRRDCSEFVSEFS